MNTAEKEFKRNHYYFLTTFLLAIIVGFVVFVYDTFGVKKTATLNTTK